MSQAPDESPADEYERELARRRAAASGVVGRCVSWSVGGHLLVPTFVCVGCIGAEFRHAGPSSEVFSALWLVGAGVSYQVSVAAAVAAFVTLRRWSVLPWPRRALGLAPWLVVCAEFALPGLVLLA
jgi:hypothetical protein